MIISALAAIIMFAAPETTKAGDVAEKPAKHCYTAKPSGSRLSRKVCVTQAPEKDRAEKDIKADPKPDAAKPE